MPRVSIVIPTYNNRDLIVQALESVRSQTYDDYEVIVVDDGSTDDTRRVVEASGSEVRYLYQENSGVAVSRNTGVRAAHGEYVAFLDSDDLWTPDNLATKVEALDRHEDLALVLGNFSIFNASGVVAERGLGPMYPIFRRTGKSIGDFFDRREPVRLRGGPEVTFYWGEVFYRLFLGNFILTSTTVSRRDRMLEAGLFRPDLKTQEDYDFFLRLARKYPMGCLDAPTVLYRRHESQLTDPSNIAAIMQTVLGILGKHEGHFRAAGKVRVFNRRMAASLLNLAKVRIGDGDRSEARRLLGNAVKLDPFLFQSYLTYLVTMVPRGVLALASKRRKR